jgi:hypothetical protein
MIRTCYFNDPSGTKGVLLLTATTTIQNFIFFFFAIYHKKLSTLCLQDKTLIYQSPSARPVAIVDICPII